MAHIAQPFYDDGFDYRARGFSESRVNQRFADGDAAAEKFAQTRALVLREEADAIDRQLGTEMSESYAHLAEILRTSIAETQNKESLADLKYPLASAEVTARTIATIITAAPGERLRKHIADATGQHASAVTRLVAALRDDGMVVDVPADPNYPRRFDLEVRPTQRLLEAAAKVPTLAVAVTERELMQRLGCTEQELRARMARITEVVLDAEDRAAGS